MFINGVVDPVKLITKINNLKSTILKTELELDDLVRAYQVKEDALIAYGHTLDRYLREMETLITHD